jgi:hypothetical protein
MDLGGAKRFVYLSVVRNLRCSLHLLGEWFAAVFFWRQIFQVDRRDKAREVLLQSQRRCFDFVGVKIFDDVDESSLSDRSGDQIFSPGFG